MRAIKVTAAAFVATLLATVVFVVPRAAANNDVYNVPCEWDDGVIDDNRLVTLEIDIVDDFHTPITWDGTVRGPELAGAHTWSPNAAVSLGWLDVKVWENGRGVTVRALMWVDEDTTDWWPGYPVWCSHTYG
jgi:hypothetical protein